MRALYCCEICGERGPKWPVEAHEIWSYDDKTLIQKLDGIVALCPDCHEVKHIGFASLNGRGEKAKQRLMTVNDWTDEEADDYLNEQYYVWGVRSQQNWTIDLSKLVDYGFAIDAIPTFAERAAAERMSEMR